MNAKALVAQLFSRWEHGDSTPFFNALSEDLIWTVTGTTKISGTYHGRDAYFTNCYKPLLAIFDGPTTCKVKRILGDDDFVVVEWDGETPTRAGPLYAQRYCWVIRINDESKVCEVTGYFDTELVNSLFVA